MSDITTRTIRITTTILLTTLISPLPPADARWRPEYAASSPEVQSWYLNAELTPEAQKRFPFVKCCDHSDVVRTQFKVNKTDAADEWWWLDGDKWKLIPPDIIHWGEHAPNNQPTLFVYAGQETCFYPGDSGIRHSNDSLSAPCPVR